MFGLFGKSTFLEKELEAWSLETWAWFQRNLPKRGAPKLVLPSKDFYPPTELEGHDRAVYLFEITKRWMHIADWPARLEVYERREAFARVSDLGLLRNSQAPNGTFQVKDGQAIISYAADLVANPRHLIATFAHELSHYLIATVREPIPGGRDVHELTTELGAAYAGYAVFCANEAFEFGQFQDSGTHGWSSRRSGYFSERTWAFCLAVFTALRDEEPPLDSLKPSIAGLTKAAARYLKRRPDLLEPLRLTTAVASGADSS